LQKNKNNKSDRRNPLSLLNRVGKIEFNKMKDYAHFYGYDNKDFYGPFLSTGYFDILEGTGYGDDPYIQLIADNEEELMRAMEEIHEVAFSLGYSIDDTFD
jgi:hypothetical protein